MRVRARPVRGVVVRVRHDDNAADVWPPVSLWERAYGMGPLGMLPLQLWPSTGRDALLPRAAGTADSARAPRAKSASMMMRMASARGGGRYLFERLSLRLPLLHW